MAEARADRPGPLLRRVGEEEEARLFSLAPPPAPAPQSILLQPTERPVGAKSCPTCGAFVVHFQGDGCHSVMCDCCGTSFCFGCLWSHGDGHGCPKGCGENCGILCCVGCTSSNGSERSATAQAERKALIAKAVSDFEAVVVLETAKAAASGNPFAHKASCTILVCEPTGDELAFVISSDVLLAPALRDLIASASSQDYDDLELSFSATTTGQDKIAIDEVSTTASLNFYGEAIITFDAYRACNECGKTDIVDFDSDNLMHPDWKQCEFCGKASCCSDMAGCIACGTRACDKCFGGGALGEKAHSDAGLFILRLRNCCCDGECGGAAVCSDCVAGGKARCLDGFKECTDCGIVAFDKFISPEFGFDLYECDGAEIFGELDSLCKACATASGYNEG
jgi:hypothetical protein